MAELLGTICLVGAVQALFLALVLAIKKNNRRANRHLALYLFFVSLDAVELYLGTRGIHAGAHPYRLSLIPYSFIFGPSMYRYTALITARTEAGAGRQYLAYVPFAVLLAVAVVTQATGVALLAPRATRLLDLAISGGGLVVEIVLYLRSLSLLQRYRRRLQECFSSFDTLKLGLIQAALVFMIVMAFFILLSYIGGRPRHQHDLFDGIGIIGGMGLVFLIAFVALLQPELLGRVRLLDTVAPDTGDDAAPRYEKLRLPPDVEAACVGRLRALMAEGKPYLNEELTLQDLAQGLDLAPHHLSMILNIHFRQNFYTFVNAHRVAEAKRLLTDPAYRDHTVLTIAFQAGFNSKTTFNTIFKKFTGQTPREFRATALDAADRA